MPKDYFGEPVAERYDESTGDMSGPDDVDPVVDFLVDLCFDGSALELGIGTGRIALPLSDAASAYTASICRRRWSQGCGRSPAQIRSA